jgi:hypothetical protein
MNKAAKEAVAQGLAEIMAELHPECGWVPVDRGRKPCGRIAMAPKPSKTPKTS